MAIIQVIGEANFPTVTLTVPVENGSYGWRCGSCGARPMSTRPIADTIADAEIHVDIQCTGLRTGH